MDMTKNQDKKQLGHIYLRGLVELWQLSDKDPVHQDAKGSSVCYLPITVRGAALWWHVSKSAPAVTRKHRL